MVSAHGPQFSVYARALEVSQALDHLEPVARDQYGIILSVGAGSSEEICSISKWAALRC